jgi:tripartite-type tricarboxylate transporter receptor subunit TctC
MIRLRKWLGHMVGLLATTAVVASPAQAQTYPTGPVRILSPQGAGGATDVAARLVAEHLGRIWGQQAILVNQPGAGGAIAARAAASATPDGHTLFMAVASTFTALSVLQPKLPFSANDFVPIGFVGEVPMAIAANKDLPVASLTELIALSKRHPGGLNIAAGFHGGVPHQTAELFRQRSGANLTPIFYPSQPQATTDVTAGRVPVTIEGMAGSIINAPVKLLAIASTMRLAARPDVPTVSETVPGFAASGWFVLVAPKGTPAAIVEKVSNDLQTVLARPDVMQRFDELNVLTRPLSLQGLSDFIRGEQQVWKPVIKEIATKAAK